MYSRLAVASLLLLLQLLAAPAQSQQTDTIFQTPASKRSSTKAVIARIKSGIPQLLNKADVPGLSAALIQNGYIVWTGAFGTSNADTKKPVTLNTVFEAASLSKPVFAYAVLKLVDEGKISLDTPLNKYLGNNYDITGDERINLITARHVLTHTSGFPNWRNEDNSPKLLIHFQPGEKFSYSGEGIVYLSKVVEKITGMSLEDFMQHYALQPLGMNASSYIWRRRYDSLKAYRHNLLGQVSGRIQPQDAKEDTAHDQGNAAASLQTTASDYAKFLLALLKGTGLKKSTWQQMLSPQVRVDAQYPQLAWGLGVGLETEPQDTQLWHWGDNGDAKAYFTVSLRDQNAIVYFADGANGLSFTKDILQNTVGREHQAPAYLDYDDYNSPAQQLLKTTVASGAAEALKIYREQRDKTGKKISESSMNTLGYLLLQMKKNSDAIAIFTQNTVDFPQSWNVWDSLAEACAADGDKAHAIEYYEKSLQLNPNNTNGASNLKKLKP